MIVVLTSLVLIHDKETKLRIMKIRDFVINYYFSSSWFNPYSLEPVEA